MALARFRARIKGTRPLLMAKADHLANPLDPLFKEIAKIRSKPTKRRTDDDYLEILRLQHMGHMHFDPKAGPYIPGEAFHRCVQAMAGLSKCKSAVQRGLLLEDEVNPLLYKGPRTVAELWEQQEQFVHVCLAGKLSKSPTARPMFQQWSCEFTCSYDTRQLDFEQLSEFITDAGMYLGILSYRPRFGRFEADVEEIE